MKLAGRDVEVVLSEEGQSALRLAGLDLPETPVAGFFVEETDDMGLWVRVSRAEEMHSLLIRWEFVLSLDLLREKRRGIGLSA
jgi:hypothetical protein